MSRNKDLQVLADSLRGVADALGEQRQVFQEYQDVNFELEAAIAELRDTVQAYKNSLSRIHVGGLKRKVRRLASIMDAAERGVEPLRLVKVA